MNARRLLLGAALSVITAAASAHAHLHSSSPADGSVISAAPSSITLEFSQSARVTAAWIQRADEPRRKLGPLPETTSSRVTIPAPELMPGRYTVSWRVVSQDGHVMSGQIRFTLAGAKGQ